MSNGQPTLYIITGPTASGKSALAVSLASRLGTEIISADSRQIYRGIPVATAVPTEEERGGVRHHFLETLPLDAYYSAALFAEEATSVIRRLLDERGSAVVAGGSMLYVDALTGALDNLPTVPDCIRQPLVALHTLRGDDWLRMRLRQLDPESASRLDPANIKRWLHALEITLTAGQPYSSLLGATSGRNPFPEARTVTVHLTGERETLFSRINLRAEMMLSAGLLDEARRVWPLRHLNSLNTVGLKEMFMHIDGEMTLPDALARMQKNTRVFAKKQMTWMKRPGRPAPDVTLPYGTTDADALLGAVCL